LNPSWFSILTFQIWLELENKTKKLNELMNIFTFCALTPLNPMSKSKVSIVTSHPISLVKATSTRWPCNSSTKANPQHFNSSYASRLALKLFGFHAT